MKRTYLTVRELLALDPDSIAKVVSETRKYGHFRCKSTGTVHSVVYDTSTKMLTWSDSEGDPVVRNIEFDDPISFRGDGKWTYGLYIEEPIYS